MRSKASFRGHPIHPAVIPFPFAFLIGSVAFDLMGWVGGAPEMSRTAAYLALAGLGTAVLAAVPGAIDYLYTVPPRSSGRRRATIHALSNVAALVLFAATWWTRGFGGPPSAGSLAVQLLGVAALVYAGWQGGVLVSRNMISVDHRYAQAGKWREISVRPGEAPVVVAAANELKEGQMKLVRVGDRRLVLARTPSGYAAFDDSCTHRGGSLAGGVLVGNTVHCLWHGSQFDCLTGRPVCGPAREPIATHPVSEGPEGVSVTLRIPR